MRKQKKTLGRRENSMLTAQAIEDFKNFISKTIK